MTRARRAATSTGRSTQNTARIPSRRRSTPRRERSTSPTSRAIRVSVDSEGSTSNPSNFATAGSVSTRHRLRPRCRRRWTRRPDKVFVANSNSTLTVVSTSTCNQTTTSGCSSPTQIASGGHLSSPAALAVNGSTLYVANSNGTVAVYSATASTTTYVTTVTLPAVHGADGAGGRQRPTVRLRRRRSQREGRVLQRRDLQRHDDHRLLDHARQPSPSATIPSPLTVAGGAGDLYVANAGSGGGISVISLSTQAVRHDHRDEPDHPTAPAWRSRSALSPDGTEVLAVLNGLSFPR